MAHRLAASHAKFSVLQDSLGDMSVQRARKRAERAANVTRAQCARCTQSHSLFFLEPTPFSATHRTPTHLPPPALLVCSEGE